MELCRDTGPDSDKPVNLKRSRSSVKGWLRQDLGRLPRDAQHTEAAAKHRANDATIGSPRLNERREAKKKRGSLTFQRRFGRRKWPGASQPLPQMTSETPRASQE